ncbi:MAG: hypothetical protein ACW97P_13075 [Candidatus Hodarchaeales archaeon]|jgi:hypothetical protein
MTRETKFNRDRIGDRIKKIRDHQKEQEDKAEEQNFFWYLVGDEFPKFKAKVGDNFLRIMPSVDERYDFDYPIFVHYGKSYIS